jgi:hypothetical protein
MTTTTVNPPAGVFPTGVPSQLNSGILQSTTSNSGYGDYVAIATNTLGSVDFALSANGISPTGSTVIFEATSDGSTWIPTKAYQKGATGSAGSTTASAIGVYNVTVAGAQQVRARLVAISTGSFVCVANGTAATAHMGVKNANAVDLNATVTIASTDAQFGTDATGVTQATGGSGLRGWLSSIYAKLLAGLNVINTPAFATLTDCSLQIAAGGTAQLLIAANAARHGWRLQNTSGGDLWFKDVGSTGTDASAGGPGCFKIASGGYYESPPGGGAQGNISVFGATSGQTFSGSWW